MSFELSYEMFKQAANYAGVEADGSIYWNYSGRGMYGRTCVGIIGSQSMATRFFIALTELWLEAGLDPADLFELADGTATDSMAWDTIFYWPHLALTDMPEDFDPENEAEEDCD